MKKQPGLRKQIALELFRKIRQNRSKLHELRTLFWECTLRCNIGCKHCGSDCRVNMEQPDMPVEDFLKVIDSLSPHVDKSKLMVVFSGGEPLVRTDLEECGRELYKREIPWGMVTNGLALTRKRLDSLLNAGMHALTISLDGFEEAHNWLRGHPKSFERGIISIGMLIDAKEIKWDVVTCVNKKNLKDLPRFKEFLFEMGVKRWRLFSIFPVGRAAQLPELQLNDKEFTEFMEFIRIARTDHRMHISYGCEGFLGEYETEVRDYMFQCNAGINTASILADGSISGCLSIRSNFYQGNIYKDDFADVWENKFISYRNREWTKKDQCADCSMYRYCEGNGMHLYDNNEKLLVCHYNRLVE
ncbi:MAG: TIGR04133 family radical SAM/SPASM protein [Tannerellaceae bacterium]|nr:TIGR04133 family radical SAM/SPASM protein [Tannerellaceae bacterium]